MDIILSIIFITAMLAAFGFGLAYFVALRNYKEIIVKDLPDVWIAARAKARPLESWVPTAYRLLQMKGNIYADKNLDKNRYAQLAVAKVRAKIFLYTSMSSFLALLVSGLLLDATAGL